MHQSVLDFACNVSGTPKIIGHNFLLSKDTDLQLEEKRLVSKYDYVPNIIWSADPLTSQLRQYAGASL